MKLRPLNDHLIVRPSEAETKTASGIFIPDSAQKEQPERGEVIAIGEGKLLKNGERAKMDIKIGDQVVFKKYAPDTIEVEGEKFLVLRADDVLAVIE